MNFLFSILPWFPPILWMAIIFTFSSFQSAHTSVTYWPDFIFKKIIHFIEYSILWWLTLRALLITFPKRSPINNGLIALFITIIYAISDELHQTFTPTREGTIRDILIDSAGAGVNFWIYLKFITQDSSSRRRQAIVLSNRRRSMVGNPQEIRD